MSDPTINEVAESLKVSPQAVYAMLRRRKVRKGKPRRVSTTTTQTRMVATVNAADAERLLREREA